MENIEILKIFRNQIDTLDKELIALLARRFEIVKQIGIIKKEDNIKPLQEDRWNKLLDDNIEMGRELLVSESLIIDIWNIIHQESLKLEK